MVERTHLLRAGVLLLASVGLSSASERSELLVSQGQAAYQAGRVAEAREHFAAAVAADPEDPAAAYGLGLALGKLGRWEEAEAPLEKAIALRPNFGEARRALGLVSYHLGEAALERKDYERAAALFGRAAELDPTHAGRARYLAGVARARAGKTEEARADFEAASRAPDRETQAAATDYLTRLGEAGAGPPPKRWEVRGLAGIEYDSNPSLEPHNVHENRDQAAFVLGAHGRYDVVQHERALVRLDYDFYQSLLPTFQDFDFRSHQLAGTASYALQRWLWAGVQGGYNHYSLGSHAYLEEPFVLPFLSFAEGKQGRTQLIYRHGEPTYLSNPFKNIRDGQTNLAGVNQLVLFEGGARYLTFGYQFEREDPRRSGSLLTASPRPGDYTHEANQAHVGVGFPAWWNTAVELDYLYRNDDYAHPNSVPDAAGVHRKRDDDEHLVYAGVRRNLAEHLNVTLAYRGTANRSNIGFFDYNRSVVALLFELTY